MGLGGAAHRDLDQHTALVRTGLRCLLQSSKAAEALAPALLCLSRLPKAHPLTTPRARPLPTWVLLQH